jgi:hypothetical protein
MPEPSRAFQARAVGVHQVWQFATDDFWLFFEVRDQHSGRTVKYMFDNEPWVNRIWASRFVFEVYVNPWLSFVSQFPRQVEDFATSAQDRVMLDVLPSSGDSTLMQLSGTFADALPWWIRVQWWKTLTVRPGYGRVLLLPPRDA